MGKFIQEFKDFALKGNVVDMAVGIIIGGAFGKIVTMPPIGLITGSNFTDAKVVLRPAEVDAAGETVKEAIELNWGNFVQTTVDFFIIAFCIFLIIKGMNSFRKKEEAQPAEPAPTPEDIELLREIRDELKRRG